MRLARNLVGGPPRMQQTLSTSSMSASSLQQRRCHAHKPQSWTAMPGARARGQLARNRAHARVSFYLLKYFQTQCASTKIF